MAGSFAVLSSCSLFLPSLQSFQGGQLRGSSFQAVGFHLSSGNGWGFGQQGVVGGRCSSLRRAGGSRRFSRLHAISDATEGSKDDPEDLEGERPQARGLGTAGEGWDAASSSDTDEASEEERTESNVGEKSESAGTSGRVGADEDAAHTKRVLDILHGRRGAFSDQRERFGYRVSGPQVPLTLQTLGSKQDAASNAEHESESGGKSTDPSVESDPASEPARAESSSGADENAEKEVPETPSGSPGTEVAASEEKSAVDSESTKKKPPVIIPGPQVAEIPIPPRTEEDERIVAAFEKKLNSDWKVQSMESELELYVAKIKALNSFKEELARPDDDIDLVRASALIAQHAYPECTPEACETELRIMADDLRQELPPPPERYPLRMIKAINRFLYEERGFKGSWGSDRDLYSPELLCINKVLSNKTGLPILMSLVYMELARRVGFPMIGVNLPLHFVIRPMTEESEFLVDPHEGGKLMFLADVQEKLASVFSAKILVNPNFFDNISATSKRDILIRILTNLKRKYFHNRNFTQCLAIIEYLKIAKGPSESAPEFRDAGLCLFALRRTGEATVSLDQYLQAAPDAPDAGTMRDLLQKIREGRL